MNTSLFKIKYFLLILFSLLYCNSNKTHNINFSSYNNLSEIDVDKRINKNCISNIRGSDFSIDSNSSLGIKKPILYKSYELSNDKLIVFRFENNFVTHSCSSNYQNPNDYGKKIDGLSIDEIVHKFGNPIFKGYTSYFDEYERYMFWYAIKTKGNDTRDYYLLIYFDNNKRAIGKISIYGFANKNWHP